MRVRNSVMVLLGVAVMVLPFLGFPGWVKTAFFVVLGFMIAIISYFAGVAHRSADLMPLVGSSVKGTQEGHHIPSENVGEHPQA